MRGVVQQFVSHDWPVPEFLAAFTSEEQFQRAVEEANRTFAGSRYVRAVCEFAQINVSVVKQHHASALQRFCDPL